MKLKLFQLKIFLITRRNIEIVKNFITKLNIQNFKEKNKKGKLSNTNVMFTGSFKKISRSEAKTSNRKFRWKSSWFSF